MVTKAPCFKDILKQVVLISSLSQIEMALIEQKLYMCTSLLLL